MAATHWITSLRRLAQRRSLSRDWAFWLGISAAGGTICVIYYGLVQGTAGNLVAALLLSGACTLIAGLLGFLFGIPRSLQMGTGSERQTEGSRLLIRANTNLEQISDWLTKILVGVGLTQLTSLPRLVAQFGDYYGPSIGGEPQIASRIAVAIFLFFSSGGFMFGFLWTRLFLGEEFARADVGATTRHDVGEAKSEKEHVQ